MRTWTLNDSIDFEKSRILNFQMNSVVREGFKNPSFIKNGVLGVISLKEFSLTERVVPPPLNSVTRVVEAFPKWIRIQGQRSIGWEGGGQNIHRMIW